MEENLCLNGKLTVVVTHRQGSPTSVITVLCITGDAFAGVLGISGNYRLRFVRALDISGNLQTTGEISILRGNHIFCRARHKDVCRSCHSCKLVTILRTNVDLSRNAENLVV